MSALAKIHEVDTEAEIKRRLDDGDIVLVLNDIQSGRYEPSAFSVVRDYASQRPSLFRQLISILRGRSA
jgi:hypothetical protein